VVRLRVFGSVRYAHVPDQRRTKLDDKSTKLVFICYDERSKAYKLYNSIEKKVILGRDIYINEQSGWDWKKQEELEIEEVEETTRNGEASSSRSSGSEEGNEDEEDEPRQS
jgi:hypothetical protein